MVSRIGNFMTWLGGGDNSILARTPYDRGKFTGMAGALLTTSGVAVLSMVFALHRGVGTSLAVAIIFGLAWGVTILNLDRFLVISIGTARGKWRLVSLALPRLALALITSVIISVPLILQIFAKDISIELHLMHDGTGIIAQLQALSILAKRNPTLNAARWATFALFTIVEILPVSIKVLLNFSPMSAYELIITSKEQELRATARQERRDLAASLNNLGVRYASLGHAEQALRATEDAIALYRNSVADNPVLLINLAGSLSNLGALYRDLGRTADALKVTREAAAMYRDLMTSNPPLAAELASTLSNLGALYIDLGRTADALKVTREAVALYGDLDRVDAAGLGELTATTANLAAALQSRYRSTGANEDLEQAIDLLERAISASPASQPDRPVLMSNLAAALQSRYRSTGANEDLEQAIDLQQQALAATPDDHPNHSLMLSKLTALGRPQRGADHD